MKYKNNRTQWTVFSLFQGLTLLTLGCATIISGTSQKIGISSTPQGASVTVDNQGKGQTPVVLKLDRGSDHTVKISMPSYKPFETTLTRKINGWFWGNLALGGIVGIIVDVTDGAMYRLKPEKNIILERQNLAGEKDVMTIATVLSPDPSWEQIGNLVPTDAPVTPLTPPSIVQTTALRNSTIPTSGVIPVNSSAGILLPAP